MHLTTRELQIPGANQQSRSTLSSTEKLSSYTGIATDTAGKLETKVGHEHVEENS
jgi:hypothetical protein